MTHSACPMTWARSNTGDDGSSIAGKAPLGASLYAVGVPWALRRVLLVTFQARWVAQFGSNPPSVVSGSFAWVSARPYGLSGPIGDCTVSVATTVFGSPSTSMSRRATMKCWWIGA